MVPIRRAQYQMQQLGFTDEERQPLTAIDRETLRRFRETLLDCGRLDRAANLQQLALLPALPGWPSHVTLEVEDVPTSLRRCFEPPGARWASNAPESLQLTLGLNGSVTSATPEQRCNFSGTDAAIRAVLWALEQTMGEAAAFAFDQMAGQSTRHSPPEHDVCALRIRAQCCDLLRTWIDHRDPMTAPSSPRPLLSLPLDLRGHERLALPTARLRAASTGGLAEPPGRSAAGASRSVDLRTLQSSAWPPSTDQSSAWQGSSRAPADVAHPQAAKRATADICRPAKRPRDDAGNTDTSSARSSASSSGSSSSSASSGTAPSSP